MNANTITALANGGLSLLEMFWPQAIPIIEIVKKATPYIGVIAPAVQAAVAEGKPAFDAAKAAAPQFTKAISDLVAHTGTPVTAAHLENAARVMGGMHKMTPDEERAWMDRASPISDDSRSGSG